MKYIPNIITIMRLLLVAPFLMYLLQGQYRYAFFIFIVAGISDGVDGFLARRFQWSSQLGRFIDPLADKSLMITAFIALTYLGEISLWLCSVVVIRDITIMVGVGIVYLVLGEVEFQPTLVSKLNTLLQIVYIVLLLLQMSYRPLMADPTPFLAYCILITTVVSLFNYMYAWTKKAYMEKHSK